MLAFHEIVEVRAYRIERLWQRLSFFDRIDGDIEGGDPGITKPIDDVGFQEPSIRRQVNEDVLVRGGVDDLVNKLRTQQRLAAHQGQHERANRVNPINRELTNVFRHIYARIV